MVVDQQNPGPWTGSNGWYGEFSFGQSFTPTVDGMDWFQFLLGGDTTAVVRVRKGIAGFDGMGGALLAQSLPTEVRLDGSAMFQFDFAQRVPLVPGEVYVAELYFAEADIGVRLTDNNAYTRGTMLDRGWPPGNFGPDRDLVFAQGVRAEVPEPPAITLLGLGLVALAVRRAGAR